MDNNEELLINNYNNWSYLVGAYMGDGCCYVGKSNYQFSITSSDKDLCDICSNIIYEEIGKFGNIKTLYNFDKISYYQLVVCSKILVNYLVKITSNRNNIPNFIINNPELHKSFIQGIMDSDGWISRVNASDGYIRYRVAIKTKGKWMPQFRDMIKNMHVKVGALRNIKQSCNNEYAIEFSINTNNYCKKIGFRINRKNLLAKEFLDWHKNGGNRKKNKSI